MTTRRPAVDDRVVDGHEPDERESGRILLLSLGFAVIGLMLVGMIASAAAVHLDHKRLYNVADLLAASAADATPIRGRSSNTSTEPSAETSASTSSRVTGR